MLNSITRNTRAVAGLAALFVCVISHVAHAQGVKDQLGTVIKAPKDEGRPPWLRKMAGSSLDLSTYAGSGTFYASGYRNPYVSAALFFRPTYDLGTRFKLSANARVYLEQEFTQSDLPNGRGFNPYDIWLWLSAKELHKFERPKLKLGGVVRMVVPLSYESRYAHMVTALAGGLTLTRTFEFGRGATPEQRWNLGLTAGGLVTKYLYTSNLRGNGPGDSNGCRSAVPGGFASGGSGGPTAATSDRCGGTVNTNFSVTSSGTVSLARGKASVAVILLVANEFRYRISRDVEAGLNQSDVGRADSTWGIVSLNYAFTEHLGASIGLSSFQPALDSRRRSLRFPFFDTSGGGNANNFTQAFASLSGTL